MSWLSKLRRLDDAISEPFFRAQLPAWATWIYAYPACFFGIPGVIGGPLQALAGASGAAPPRTYACWATLLVVTYVVCFRSIMRGVANACHGEAVARQGGFLKRDLTRARKKTAAHVQGASNTLSFYKVVPCLTFALAYRVFPEGVLPLQYFAFATLLTQIPIVLIKRFAARRRPCARTDWVTPLPPRHVPLSAFVGTGRYTDESFPSGDAAEAVVFAATVLRFGLWPPAVAYACVFLSATGRVFFQVHHFLDVVVGSAVAAAVSLATAAWLTEEAEWWLPVAAVAGWIGLDLAIRRFTAHRHSQDDGNKAPPKFDLD